MEQEADVEEERHRQGAEPGRVNEKLGQPGGAGRPFERLVERRMDAETEKGEPEPAEESEDDPLAHPAACTSAERSQEKTKLPQEESKETHLAGLRPAHLSNEASSSSMSSPPVISRKICSRVASPVVSLSSSRVPEAARRPLKSIATRSQRRSAISRM